MNKLSVTLFALLAISTIACSNNDEPKIPTNALTLNMMIGDRGTAIGGSDVIIDESSNFSTSRCAIADLGTKSGFGQNPNLTQIAQNVAIPPGNFYQIALVSDIETVAEARAMPLNANYYNVYVDSWIYNKDNDIVGAKIKYAESYPQYKNLPEWGKTIDLKLNKNKAQTEETAAYSFPKGCKIDSEYDIDDQNGSYDLARNLNVEIKDNQIKFSNTYPASGGTVPVKVLVRYESTYTKVYFNVKTSYE